ncbi:unnamed protein product [Rhizophagus irregularis]|nr:unnamed protein product [Rhizophagus irregularis]
MPPVGKGKGKEVKKASKRKSLSFCAKKRIIILKEKEKWLCIDIANKELSNQKRDRGAKFPEIESALYLWMQQALASNLTITGDILKAKALNFATQLQTTTFTASDGWLSKFKKRYNIKQFIKAGEANSAPLETLEEERVALQEIIEQYDLRDVYNVDETEDDFDQNTIDDDINEITLELQDIINELNLQDPITAKEFICIDDEIPIESLSDKEIIDAVISNPENNNTEEDEESEINIITNKEALNSLEKVILYFKNPPDDITINYTELKSLNILKSKINKKIQDNVKQFTLDSYMNLC